MPRKKKVDPTSAPLFEAKTTTAPCVPAIRDKVTAWRTADYPGATDTTRRLLNHWFLTDHRLPSGRKFAYHPSQRQAVETLVYLFEIAKVRRQKDLIETYAHRQDLKLLQYDDFARYCIKMATGSGKTKVIALAIAWQFFNAVAEPGEDYAKTFLLIAPNVIVFERLRSDFAGGAHYLLETKGLEDVNVAFKDRAAHLWCENATVLTGTPWTYLKVRQMEYVSLQPTQFADLLVLAR